MPVLSVQMPAGPDEPRFFGAILDALAFPNIVAAHVSKRQDTAVRLMRETNVQLLVIDAVHNLLCPGRACNNVDCLTCYAGSATN